MGILLSAVIVERTPSIPRNVADLETIDFADVFGAIAEDHHLTRCAQVCFKGTEKNQAERHDDGTIGEVLGDEDVGEGRGVSEETDREADLLEQVLVTQNPSKNVQRLGSVLAASSSPCPRCDLATTPKLAASTGRSTCADATCCPISKRLIECCQDLSMLEMRQHKAETSHIQSVTSTLYLLSRSGSRCVRDR